MILRLVEDVPVGSKIQIEQGYTAHVVKVEQWIETNEIP